jgi:hypothetical protein
MQVLTSLQRLDDGIYLQEVLPVRAFSRSMLSDRSLLYLHACSLVRLDLVLQEARHGNRPQRGWEFIVSLHILTNLWRVDPQDRS